MQIETTGQLSHMSRRKLFAMGGMAAIAMGVKPDALFAADTAVPAGKAPSTGASGSLPWPRRAKFGGKAIVGPHQASAAAMIDDSPVLGLPRERTFFYGNVRDAEGNLYELVRGMAGKGFGGLDQLFIQSSKGMDTLHVDMASMGTAAPSAGHKAQLDAAGNAVWTSAPGAKGAPFRISMSADGSKAAWKEGDLFELEGELLGPGLQWTVPDADNSEFYVSQVYEMKGHYKGTPVRGILGLDQSYLPQGVLMYSGKDPLFLKDQHHRCWYTWGTRYEDGSYESGHFVLGTERVGFALITNQDGELILDTEVTGNVDLMDDNVWPRRIVVHTSGGNFEFLPDPKGRMPDLLGNIQSFTPQNEGRWRRIGDSRKPVSWFAWGEVQSADRIDYEQHTRF
ncbi:hypothetical protein [Novosphingobium malaysiense]|uniref:AttH domain-containing protein n=1 Tax=Novosphingobium malaysiense TaxID=1348853 RepID=A0A0B1ZEY7_9SPHN|nr:hypothetical protein [Novosphingobium malaysiense]KHK89055.1 hypothetical protein LK12_22120 [Novosphingobium malaysiense]